jgi:hypothetical protein
MGFLKDFFARKQDTEDEERGGTAIIFPERVMTLILLFADGTDLPKSATAQRELVWRVFSLVNPDLNASLPDREQVTTLLHNTAAIQADGHIEPDDYLEILDTLQIPNMASSYIQSLKLTDDKIAIWLREPRREDKHFDIALEKPISTGDFTCPEDATLITIYASDVPKVMSMLYPALPKVLEPGDR